MGNKVRNTWFKGVECILEYVYVIYHKRMSDMVRILYIFIGMFFVPGWLIFVAILLKDNVELTYNQFMCVVYRNRLSDVL